MTPDDRKSWRDKCTSDFATPISNQIQTTKASCQNDDGMQAAVHYVSYVVLLQAATGAFFGL